MASSPSSESPLLKLRQELERADDAKTIARSQADSLMFLIREAEERWERERELHKSQVKRIRKQRHECIVLLRKQVEDARALYAQVLRMDDGS